MQLEEKKKELGDKVNELKEAKEQIHRLMQDLADERKKNAELKMGMNSDGRYDIERKNKIKDDDIPWTSSSSSDSESSDEEDSFDSNALQGAPQIPRWMVNASVRKPSTTPISSVKEPSVSGPRIRRISCAPRRLQPIGDLKLSCTICKTRIELEDVEKHSMQCEATGLSK